MASLTVIWWRDIPAQVLAREGRRASKVQLHPRFQVAIDKAASRAGKRTYNEYIEEWRKVARACGEDLEAEVNAEVDRIETEYDKHRLAELIQTGGVAGGPVFPPAHDETQRARTAPGGDTAQNAPPNERPHAPPNERPHAPPNEDPNAPPNEQPNEQPNEPPTAPDSDAPPNAPTEGDPA